MSQWGKILAISNFNFFFLSQLFFKATKSFSAQRIALHTELLWYNHNKQYTALLFSFPITIEFLVRIPLLYRVKQALL